MEKIIVTNEKELEQLISKSIQKAMDAKSSQRQPSIEILTLEEASQHLNIAKQTIYGFTSKRLIPHFKRGKKLYFKKSELDDWMLESKKATVKEIEAIGGLLS